jgi:ubiquinone/menaquinone biosynthesis C-methylase UbiE
MPHEQLDRSATQDTLQYNAQVYAQYYRNPFLMYRYDLLYREGRIARLLAANGVEVSRPGFRALEYGFGAGHMLRVVSGASSVEGFEASPSAVERARALAPKDHPSWTMREWRDATQLPVPDASVDLMTASHVLEHVEDDEAALDEWIRVIAPGGHLLILLPSNERLFPGSKHLRLYDRDQFRARLASKGLQEVSVDEHQRFDRPFKDHRLILFSRRGGLAKLLVDGPRTALFLPPCVISWQLLRGVDALLATLGMKSSSIAYLFRKPS